MGLNSSTKILIVHTDRKTRKFLETACAARHQVTAAADLKTGLKMILKTRPALVIAGLEARKKEALVLMRYMKQYNATMPVLVVGSRGSGALQPAAQRFGAKGFVEFPVDQARLDREISKILQADTDAHDGIPAITDEEKDTNLTQLESRLNRHMKCAAGKNQVFLQALIIGTTKTKPRIALKCSLRQEFGLKRDVYYEYIRDVCCSDPGACPAVQKFQARTNT